MSSGAHTCSDHAYTSAGMLYEELGMERSRSTSTASCPERLAVSTLAWLRSASAQSTPRPTMQQVSMPQFADFGGHGQQLSVLTVPTCLSVSERRDISNPNHHIDVRHMLSSLFQKIRPAVGICHVHINYGARSL